MRRSGSGSAFTPARRSPRRGGYTGLAVHRAARICAAARSGQVLVSQATQTIIEEEEEEEEEEPGFTLLDLGEHKLKDLDRPVRLRMSIWRHSAGPPGACGSPGTQPGGRRDAPRGLMLSVRIPGGGRRCDMGLAGRMAAPRAGAARRAGLAVPARRRAGGRIRTWSGWVPGGLTHEA